MNHYERANLRKLAAQDILNGLSKKEIIKKYNKSPSWVERVCKDNEIKFPSNNRGKIHFNSFTILTELFNINKSLKKIAEESNISYQRVQQIYDYAKKAGIPGLPLR